jgi:ABC-type uncharacterized transport system ATPase component
MLRKELSIFSFRDLLEYYPLRHIDKTKVEKIGALQYDSDYVQVAGKLVDMQMLGEKRSKRLVAHLNDGTGIIELVWFQGISWVEKTLQIGNNKEFKKLIKDKIASLGMGLENKIDQPMGSLSGGQRQALTLLMSVMDDTNVLLMDEPTAALDPKSAQIILQIADKMNKEMGLTILLVTHSLRDAHQYGNRLLQFKEGAIIRDIKSNEKSSLTLPDLYNWF